MKEQTDPIIAATIARDEDREYWRKDCETKREHELNKVPMHHQGAAMPVPGDNWTDDDAQFLISELRMLVWKFGPRNMVLDDAETLAQHCWTSIRDGQPWK